MRQIPPAAKSKNSRLTDEEAQCIRTLQLLADKWPETLFLFAGGPDTNTVHILKTDENGDPVRLPEERGGGYDPKSIVGQVTIPNVRAAGASVVTPDRPVAHTDSLVSVIPPDPDSDLIGIGMYECAPLSKNFADDVARRGVIVSSATEFTKDR